MLAPRNIFYPNSFHPNMRVRFVGDDISLQTFQIIIGLHLQDITAEIPQNI